MSRAARALCSGHGKRARHCDVARRSQDPHALTRTSHELTLAQRTRKTKSTQEAHTHTHDWVCCRYALELSRLKAALCVYVCLFTLISVAAQVSDAPLEAKRALEGDRGRAAKRDGGGEGAVEGGGVDVLDLAGAGVGVDRGGERAALVQSRVVLNFVALLGGARASEGQGRGKGGAREGQGLRVSKGGRKSMRRPACAE